MFFHRSFIHKSFLKIAFYKRTTPDRRCYRLTSCSKELQRDVQQSGVDYLIWHLKPASSIKTHLPQWPPHSNPIERNRPNSLACLVANPNQVLPSQHWHLSNEMRFLAGSSTTTHPTPTCYAKLSPWPSLHGDGYGDGGSWEVGAAWTKV